MTLPVASKRALAASNRPPGWVIRYGQKLVLVSLFVVFAACSGTTGAGKAGATYTPGDLNAEQRARCREVAQAYVDRAPQYPELLSGLRSDPTAIAWFVRYLEAEIVSVREARTDVVAEETVAAADVPNPNGEPVAWDLPGQRRDERAFRQIVAIGKPAIDVIVNDLARSSQEFLRSIGIELLARLGDEAVPKLLKLARKGSSQEQRVAARALGQIGARGVSLEALRQLSQSKEWNIRSAAASGLAAGSLGARDLLVQMLGDEDAFVRRKAGEALANYRDSVAVGALVDFLVACQTSKDWEGELSAQTALRTLAKSSGPRSVASWRRFASELAEEEDGR
jgi:HEAT repeat protein